MSINSKVAVRTVERPPERSRKKQAVAAAVIDLGDYTESPLGGTESSSSWAADATDPSTSSAWDSSHCKHFSERRIDGQPLSVRMARRLSECEWVDGIYAVGCNVPTSVMRNHQMVLEPISLPPCHLVERLSAVVDRTDAEWIVYVPANRPFVDAGLIDGLIAKAARTSNCDYVGYNSDKAGPSRMLHLGLAGEVVHADALRRLRRNADRLAPCCSIAECMQHAPGDYRLKFVPVPRELDRADLRFAVEDESDWDDLQLLCESVSDVDASWMQVKQLVEANEPLRSSMKSRNG
ncbi:hypothetical protein FYK55_22880 [Roseiconus nitratireducens]|uniref:MobA-like NTP transferase domain-containing protein n=1 Tax=Roseiconus nitratireducens TaxID=2605748 RepID=A0A5M6D3Y4_9BACT|nr:hypothetical protein [Roseiconus nitratireducens]KAA5539895.1 hypothetical protein FYK55_22880 [Roseiconus nitratireducens]